jgi:hypothetical protein
MAIEMIEQARPNVKKAHIELYAGENQELRKSGMTSTRLPSTAMMLFWMRYQKSASPVVPMLFSDLEIAKPLYPGMMAATRNSKLTATSLVVSFESRFAESTRGCTAYIGSA